MMIRQDFHPQTELPPRMFMEQIMDGVSKSYCFLWDHKDEENKFQITWKDLNRYYNKNTFRSNLRKLNDEGLLDYEESTEGIVVELVGWDEITASL